MTSYKRVSPSVICDFENQLYQWISLYTGDMWLDPRLKTNSDTLYIVTNVGVFKNNLVTISLL